MNREEIASRGDAYGKPITPGGVYIDEVDQCIGCIRSADAEFINEVAEHYRTHFVCGGDLLRMWILILIIAGPVVWIFGSWWGGIQP